MDRSPGLSSPDCLKARGRKSQAPSKGGLDSALVSGYLRRGTNHEYVGVREVSQS